MVELQRMSQFKMLTFRRRQRTLEGNFGSDRNANPNYGREAVKFSFVSVFQSLT